MVKKSKTVSMKDLYYTYQDIGIPVRPGGKMTVGIDYNSQRTALILILKNFGGPLNIAEQLEVFSGTKDYPLYGLLSGYTAGDLRNWSGAGIVPLRECGKIAEFLEIKPEILNYSEVSNFKIYVDKWVNVVEDCYCLTAEDKKIILRQKPYPVNLGV